MMQNYHPSLFDLFSISAELGRLKAIQRKAHFIECKKRQTMRRIKVSPTLETIWDDNGNFKGTRL